MMATRRQILAGLAVQVEAHRHRLLRFSVQDPNSHRQVGRGDRRDVQIARVGAVQSRRQDVAGRGLHEEPGGRMRGVLDDHGAGSGFWLHVREAVTPGRLVVIERCPRGNHGTQVEVDDWTP